MLFVVVTVAAVASWAYWVGWPWWLDSRERTRFEESAKKLKAGTTHLDAIELVSFDLRRQVIHKAIGSTESDFYVLPGAIYAICYTIPKDPSIKHWSTPCKQLKVFQIPPVSQEYLDLHRNMVSPERWYVDDISTQISRHGKSNPGFQYELIYSDPPAKPEGK
jgi:hypothetical protein